MAKNLNTETGVESIGPIEAHMKVIDPLLSTGPSTRVRVTERSDKKIAVRVPRNIFIGAMIHLRIGDSMVLGVVRECDAVGDEFLIYVAVREVF